MLRPHFNTDCPRVYVAAPVTTYRTARHDHLHARARERFPGSEVLPARGMFASAAQWRARWPDILATLSVVVFIADENGWIGWGV